MEPEALCIVMTGSVCLYVREHISRTTCPIFTKFLCLLPMPAARSSSGGVAICYVLPVLWYMVRNRRRNRDSMGSSTDLSRRRTLKLVHQGPEPDRGGESGLTSGNEARDRNADGRLTETGQISRCPAGCCRRWVRRPGRTGRRR